MSSTQIIKKGQSEPEKHRFEENYPTSHLAYLSTKTRHVVLHSIFIYIYVNYII